MTCVQVLIPRISLPSLAINILYSIDLGSMKNYFIIHILFFLSPAHWPTGFSPRLSHTKDSKMVFIATLLNILHFKVQIKGKVEQTKEKSRTPLLFSVVAIEKVILDYGHQIFLNIHTYRNIYIYIYNMVEFVTLGFMLYAFVYLTKA